MSRFWIRVLFIIFSLPECSKENSNRRERKFWRWMIEVLFIIIFYYEFQILDVMNSKSRVRKASIVQVEYRLPQE